MRPLSGNILTASPTLTTKCFSTSGLPRQNQQEPFKGAKGKKSKYGQAFKSKARRSSKHLDQPDLKTTRTERSQNESTDVSPKNLVQIDEKLFPIKVNMIWRWGNKRMGGVWENSRNQSPTAPWVCATVSKSNSPLVFRKSLSLVLLQ